MTTSSATKPIPTQRVLEDPLAHLPCSTIQEFRKGQIIYHQAEPPTGLCLVIVGKVKVCRTMDLRQVLIDIYQADEFFGETALIGLPRCDTAAALENTQIMTWSSSELERLAIDRPKLAIALLQLVAQRSADFGCRIETMATDSISRRLARALIRFSERFGFANPDGSTQMIPMTHEVLAQYVGTSREIVTHHLTAFRRREYLRYSRKGSAVNVEALKSWLAQEHGGEASVKHPRDLPERAASACAA